MLQKLIHFRWEPVKHAFVFQCLTSARYLEFNTSQRIWKVSKEKYFFGMEYTCKARLNILLKEYLPILFCLSILHVL